MNTYPNLENPHLIQIAQILEGTYDGDTPDSIVERVQWLMDELNEERAEVEFRKDRARYWRDLYYAKKAEVTAQDLRRDEGASGPPPREKEGQGSG